MERDFDAIECFRCKVSLEEGTRHEVRIIHTTKEGRDYVIDLYRHFPWNFNLVGKHEPRVFAKLYRSSDDTYRTRRNRLEHRL